MRVFLDANIIFSAAWSRSNPTQYLFQLAALERHELLSSAFALDEARRNLELKTPNSLPEFERLQSAITQAAEPDSSELEIAVDADLPDKDAPILASAITAKADLLVTGDRTHFGHLFGECIQGTRILTLSNTLALLLETATR